MISKEDVSRIANLAKLDFSEDELQRFVPGFGSILDYFQQLENIETEDVEPTYHAIHGNELQTPLHPDECSASLPPEAAVGEAPETKENQFRVPKVIE